MSTDNRKDDIITLISKNGPMGVNALQRELNIPLSTLQKYLHNQSYFKINDNKKWDLPENVIGEIKNNSLLILANVVESSIMLLKSQLEELQQHTDNALVPISTIKKSIDRISAPVAGSSPKIHPTLVKVLEEAGYMVKTVKSHKSTIPEEYYDLLLNMDLVRIMVKKGYDYYQEVFVPDVSSIILGERDMLTDEVLKLIESYQKGGVK